ncbi:hypothetical protein AB205_0106520 [Aquarana catesbeiana]|uniref:Uncharacterized protein n=1 Tax=Aquarana catesbeiana TaxID=8400 RepID=A0A2G9SC15_AQUCT|nr:hypothetical protein AB205_0106520 [Aquarana catesbeiana]
MRLLLIQYHPTYISLPLMENLVQMYLSSSRLHHHLDCS